MLKEDYDIIIEAGHSNINDSIIGFLSTKCVGRVLDVGCNTGWLLSIVGGAGVEKSELLADIARKRGLNVVTGDATKLPFKDKEFDTVVLSCVLEQISDWKSAAQEAIRVGKRVIGINPIPGSRWGVIGGYVSSVIKEDEMRSMGFSTTKFDEERYFFEICA